MMDSNIIYKYFPDLTGEQKQQIDALEGLYSDWNSKINVISRKDMDCFYVHHVLHSLAIAKFMKEFLPSSCWLILSARRSRSPRL